MISKSCLFWLKHQKYNWNYILWPCFITGILEMKAPLLWGWNSIYQIQLLILFRTMYVWTIQSAIGKWCHKNFDLWTFHTILYICGCHPYTLFENWPRLRSDLLWNVLLHAAAVQDRWCISPQITQFLVQLCSLLQNRIFMLYVLSYLFKKNLHL